jgi:hypothetical protein
VQVTSLAWHPASKILAVGWENGELFYYSDHNNTCIEIPTIHNASGKHQLKLPCCWSEQTPEDNM